MTDLKSRSNGSPGVNRLLAALPKKEYKRILPKLKTVNLVLGETLYEPGFFIDSETKRSNCLSQIEVTERLQAVNATKRTRA